MTEHVDIHAELTGVARFDHDAKRVAKSVDNIGDQARQAARAFRQLSRASADTRLNLGPLSVKARTGALAVGAFAGAITKATPALLGFAEATATVAAGGAGAGAVGLTALGQGFFVASVASKDLTAALGGNEAALKRLTPQAAKLFDILSQRQEKLKGTIGAALFPGLTQGTRSALRNFGAINRVAGSTGQALGGLAQRAGSMLGSKAFGADIGTVGSANVKIIRNLGSAGLSLANSMRSILASAAPLAVWLSENVRRGAQLLDVWIQQKRAGGELAQFFNRAKSDLRVLASIGGHTGRGIINLFGSRDVDGTKTLQSFDRLMAGFERWSRTAKSGSVGQAIADQIPKAGGLIASALAHTLASAVPQAAKIFWEAFWSSDAAGKALIGGALLKKSGAFGALGKGLGRLTSGAGALGVTRKTPLPVFVVNEGFGGGGGGVLRSAAKAAIPAAVAVGGGVGAGVAAGVVGRQIVGPQRTTPQQRQAARFGTINVTVPVHVNGREVARAQKMFQLNEAARNSARAGISKREQALSAQYGWGF